MPTQTLLTHLIKTTAIRYRKQEQVQRETACKTCIFIPVVVYHINIHFLPDGPSFCCLEPSSSRLTFLSSPPLIYPPTRCFRHVQLQRGVLLNAH